MSPWIFLVALLAAPAPVQHHPAGGADLVHVDSPVHRSAYAEGLYLLHNFEYSRAAEAFRRAQASRPDDVMAYWGEAMTYNHPLWAFQDRDKAREVLARLGPTREARRAKASTARQALWLDAVEALYGDGDKLARDRSYQARMMALHLSDPADIEARSFAALATLGLAHKGRDTALYMKAAAMLEEGFATNAAHPGVLHYLIHSYDDPAHAPLGVRAARRYGPLAPDAAHAQHMVSHIYLPLGEWEEVERTNLQAAKVVNAQRIAAGQPPSSCGHYTEWVAYARDQQGKDSRPLVDACEVEALAELAAGKDGSVLGHERSSFNNWVTMAVRQGVQTGRWPAATAVEPGNSHLLGRFELAYGRLLAARRDPVTAEATLSELRRDRALIAAAWTRERPDDHQRAPWFDIAVAQGEAIVALARGDTEQGLRGLRAAAQAEAALPQPFGPPILAKPSAELLGDELLMLGRKSDAADAYENALAAMPQRRLSVAGLANAQQ